MTTLNFTQQGKGEPLILLHGFLEDNSMWNFMLDAYPSNKIICIELPGHGKSIGMKGNWSLHNMALAVKNCILKSVGTSSISIIGHSLGGYIGLRIAEMLPQQMKHLILLHSHPWPDKEEKKKDRTRVAAIVDYNKTLFINEAIPGLFYDQKKYQTEIDNAIAIASKMKKENIIQTIYAMRDRHSKVSIFNTIPNLSVIQGAHDPLIDAKKMETLCHQSHANFFFNPQNRPYGSF